MDIFESMTSEFDGIQKQAGQRLTEAQIIAERAEGAKGALAILKTGWDAAGAIEAFARGLSTV